MMLLCFILCSLNYVSMAIFGYLMYGPNVQSQITLNLPSQLLASKLAIYITLLNPLTKYALLVTPIASAIEDWFVASRFKFILIRTLLVVSTTVAALTLPIFGYLMALTGSFLCTSASILLPCICYLKIFHVAKRWSIECAAILAIMLLGILIAIMGTYTSMKKIVSHL